MKKFKIYFSTFLLMCFGFHLFWPRWNEFFLSNESFFRALESFAVIFSALIIALEYCSKKQNEMEPIANNGKDGNV